MLLAVMALGLLAIGIAWVIALVLIFYPSGIDPLPFDSTTWKASPAAWEDDSLRLRMVDDLLETRTLVGLHRDQVVDLVGEPDDTSYFSDYEMVYRLGPERGFIRIDSEWLVFDLDDNGRVLQVELVTD